MALPAPQGLAPLNNVLVPVDFSAGSALAFRRALLLPLAEGAKLSVVHVLPAALPAKTRSGALAGAQRSLERLLSQGRRKLQGRRVTLSSEVLSGEPFIEVIRHSRRLRAELIVLGRHGRRSLRDMLIGTTAERIIRKGDAPTLVVSLRPTHPYRRPLVATDCDDTAPRTVALALRVLGPAVTTVQVVHAFNVPFEGFVTPTFSAKEKSDYRRSFRQKASSGVVSLLAHFHDTGVHFETTIRSGDPRSVILVEAAGRRTDLLALGTHGRSGLSHALIGSVAEWAIMTAPCDVLVARPVRFAFELP